MAKKFYEVVGVDSANKHLPNPLLIGEIVQEIDDENLGDQYIRVHHNGGKNVSSFSRNKFKRYTPKDKLELVKLIKTKGLLPEIKKDGK